MHVQAVATDRQNLLINGSELVGISNRASRELTYDASAGEKNVIVRESILSVGD